MIVIGVEEGDLEASNAEKFGEFKQGVEVALRRQREEEDMMGRDRRLIHLAFWFTIHVGRRVFRTINFFARQAICRNTAAH